MIFKIFCPESDCLGWGGCPILT